MPGYEDRTHRSRRQALMKAGVWVFLVLFAMSILGVAIVTVRTTQ